MTAPVVDPYREPACRWCPGNRGIEYATTPGMLVRAVAAGRVTFAGSVAGIRYVVVEHANGWRVTYGNLRELTVERGALVVRRAVVGATTSRLHLGLRDVGGYRDPTPYLGRLVYRPRLVPVDGSAGPPPGTPTLRCHGSGWQVPNRGVSEESAGRNR